MHVHPSAAELAQIGVSQYVAEEHLWIWLVARMLTRT